VINQGNPRVAVEIGLGEELEDFLSLDRHCRSQSRATGGDWPGDFWRLRGGETHCHPAV